jgi:tetratricopeptide (TPR) repeat protein
MGKLAAALLMVLAVSSPARAQPKSPTPQQNQQAGDLVKKAIARSQAGDHLTAIDLYQQAYVIVPTPILLSNIGSEYEQAHKQVEALKYFCKYLDADPTGSNASYATAKAKALQIELGNPVDDAGVCKPPPPPPAPTPAPKPPASSPTVDQTSFEPAGGPARDAGDDHPGRVLEVTGGGIAAIGVASLAVGFVYALKAKSLNDQINNHKMSDPWPTTIDGVPIGQWDTQGSDWNRNTYIFMIGGGVVAAAGIVVFIVGHGESEPVATDHVSLVPTITPGGGGLVMSGRF